MKLRLLLSYLMAFNFAFIYPAISDAKVLNKSVMPKPAYKFIQGKKQFLSVSDLNEFSNSMPEGFYKKLNRLSKKFSKETFSVQRNGSKMLLTDGKNNLEAQIVLKDDLFDLLIDGRRYNPSSKKDRKRFLRHFKAKYQQRAVSSYSFGLNKICSLIFYPFNEAQAKLSGWFFIGGMAILAFAIIYAINKAKKTADDLKNTNHTVNIDVAGIEDTVHQIEVKPDEETTAALDDLKDTIKEEADEIRNNPDAETID